MRGSVGLIGVFGIVFAVGGIGVLAYENPLVALGVLAVVIGLGLLIQDLVRNALAQFGMV